MFDEASEVADPSRCGGRTWSQGDAIALVGPFDPSLAGSELEKLRGQLGPGLPEVEVESVAAAISLVRGAIGSGDVKCATDVSDGGLFTALAELAIRAGFGFRCDLVGLMARVECAAEDALFGEGSGGFILAGHRQTLEALGGRGVPVEMIGSVEGSSLFTRAGELEVEIPLDDATRAFESLAARIEA